MNMLPTPVFSFFGEKKSPNQVHQVHKVHSRPRFMNIMNFMNVKTANFPTGKLKSPRSGNVQGRLS